MPQQEATARTPARTEKYARVLDAQIKQALDRNDSSQLRLLAERALGAYFVTGCARLSHLAQVAHHSADHVRRQRRLRHVH